MPGRPNDFWLLDLDGTLVDVRSSYVHETMGRVGDRLGVPFGPDEAEALWSEDAARRRAVLDAHGVAAPTFWETFHEVEDPTARAEATFVYEDAAAVVPTLSGPVGLVTHNQHAEPVIDHLDIRDWFDAVVQCDDGTGWKPDPAPLEHAMADLGVSPGAGAMAGDATADLGAARNAGLEAVHVVRHGRTDTSAKSDRRIATLTELDA